MRFDLSAFATKYGVDVRHIGTSDLANMSNMFHPCTEQMESNFARNIDRIYSHFKDIVASGRNMPHEDVESLAAGRVWTGAQAQNNGLVDEIGGLDRAISFARRNYTQGEAKVVRVTDQTDFRAWLRSALSAGALLSDYSKPAGSSSLSIQNALAAKGFQNNPLLCNALPFASGLPSKAFDVYLTVDENTAIQSLWECPSDDSDGSTVFDPDFWI